MRFTLPIITISALFFLSCGSSDKGTMSDVKEYVSDTAKSLDKNVSTKAKNISTSINTGLVGVGIRLGIIDIIGSWSAGDNHIIQFGKDGKGFFVKDKSYNGHEYSYYREFDWARSGNIVRIRYTSETSIRDGNQIVREKTLSEKAMYKISGGTLHAEGQKFNKK